MIVFINELSVLQMVPNRGRAYGYPPQGRNMPASSMQGGFFSSVPSHDRERQPLGALASSLANASPDQQRTVCFFWIRKSCCFVSTSFYVFWLDFDTECLSLATHFFLLHFLILEIW